MNWNKKLNLKILLLIIIIVLPILSTFALTFFQDVYIKKKEISNRFLNVETKTKNALNDKLVLLSNLLFLRQKFNFPKNSKNSLVNLNRKIGGLNLRSIVRKIIVWSDLNKKSNYGEKHLAPIEWTTLNNFIAGTLISTSNHKVKEISKSDPNFFDWQAEVIENDLKRSIFAKLKGWIKLININNIKNVEKLKGYLKSREISNAFESSFIEMDNFLSNPEIRNFFQKSPYIGLIQNFDFENFISVWKFWSNTLLPFYEQTEQLKKTDQQKRVFLKEYLRNPHNKNKYTKTQIKDLIQKIDDAGISLNRVFKRLTYYNGFNLAETVHSTLKAFQTDIQTSKFNWLNLITKQLNQASFTSILNILGTFFLQHKFDEMIDPSLATKTTIQPKIPGLNDVLSDFINFAREGLLSDAEKFNFLIDGLNKGIESLPANEVINFVNKPGGKFFNLKKFINWSTGTINKIAIFELINQQTSKAKIDLFIAQTKKIPKALKDFSKVFGNFEINRLKPIFENETTIRDLKSKINNFQQAFTAAANTAVGGDINYKKALIEIISRGSKLFNYLISNNILNNEIDSNLNLWTFFGLNYYSKQHPHLKKIYDVVWILFENFKNNEIAEILGTLVGLVDEIMQVVIQFIEWKTAQGEKFLDKTVLIEKISELIGLTENTKNLGKNTLLRKLFDKLLATKEKYLNQILKISEQGERFFAKKSEKFWNRIQIKNWKYQLKIRNKWNAMIAQPVKIYTFIIETKSLPNSVRYKYRIVWEVDAKTNSDINLVDLKEIP